MRFENSPNFPKILDAVYEMNQRKKICGRKRVKVELSHKGRTLKRARNRSISPETYRKYGSRTPSPVRKRSRSRSPLERKKPLKPNKPRVSSSDDDSSETTSSSSEEEDEEEEEEEPKKKTPPRIESQKK